MFDALFAPAGPSTPLSRYITWNGALYLSSGVMFWVWPYGLEWMGAPALSDTEAGYVRAIGIAVIQIGWFYLWGARTRSDVFGLSTVVNRLAAPLLILPLVFTGRLEPALGIPFALLDPVLGVGAWLVWRRSVGVQTVTAVSGPATAVTKAKT